MNMKTTSKGKTINQPTNKQTNLLQGT